MSASDKSSESADPTSATPAVPPPHKKKMGEINLYLARARRFVRNPALSADGWLSKSGRSQRDRRFWAGSPRSGGFSLLFIGPRTLFRLTSLTSSARTVRIFSQGARGITTLPSHTPPPRCDRSTVSPCFHPLSNLRRGCESTISILTISSYDIVCGDPPEKACCLRKS